MIKCTIPFVILLATYALSCEESETTEPQIEEIKASADTVFFESVGGIDSLEINAPMEWIAREDANWLSVTGDSTAPTGKLIIEAMDNEIEEDREETIYLYAGPLSKKVFVKQLKFVHPALQP